MHYGPLTIQFKQKMVKMKTKIREIHTKRGKKTQITTIRIFSWKLQDFRVCIQFSFKKLQFKFWTAKIMPLNFYKLLIHLELLIFIQVDFLWFETDLNDYK
jgi:hypothetical protein